MSLVLHRPIKLQALDRSIRSRSWKTAGSITRANEVGLKEELQNEAELKIGITLAHRIRLLGAGAMAAPTQSYYSLVQDKPVAEQPQPQFSEADKTLAPGACGVCDQAACDTQGCDSCGTGSCGLGRQGGLLGGCGLGGCDSACDSNGCDQGILGLGLVKKSDTCFNDFISPITNTAYFEDPRNLSELRFVFIHHEVPTAAAGGQINAAAMQFRARLTKRLSLIATKDGYMESSNPLIGEGWLGVNAGLKYNLYADAARGVLTSVGTTYEVPMGSSANFQKYGNGQFHFFTTHGRRIGCNMHLISASGIRVPTDDNLQNRMFYWSNHLDYAVTRRFYALTELNWYNWLSSGSGPLSGVEGGDLFSLGSSNVTGNDIVTQAVGGKYKRNAYRELGFAYEFPLTERRDVLKDRITLDYIVRY